jgi:carbonic anhydrase/acetyltransferase-like protein (isoleucine patch superfamily)
VSSANDEEVPQVDPTAWLADSVELYGKVTIGADSSLWPQCVIRAECQEVRIGRHTNLQDFVMIHVGYDDPCVIGDFCSITHHATVHGAVVEDDCLIGINAVVMDGAVIGRGSIVAPGAVVTEGTNVPPHSIVAGVPARVIKERDSTAENRMNAWSYWTNARAYREGHHRAWTGADYRAFLREKRKAEGIG